MAQLSSRALGVGLATLLIPVISARAGDGADPLPDQANSWSREITTVGVAASTSSWAAHLPRPVGDAPRVEVWIVPFAGGLRPRLGGRRQTRCCAWMGKEDGSMCSAQWTRIPRWRCPRAARDPSPRPGQAPDQIGASRCTNRGCPAARCSGPYAVEQLDRVLPEDAALKGSTACPWLQLGMIEERPTERRTTMWGFRRRGLSLPGRRSCRASRAQLRTPGGLTRLSSSPTDGLSSSATGDRHQAQWSWARFDSGDVHWWRAHPRDRDQAFARPDGSSSGSAGYYWTTAHRASETPTRDPGRLP